MANTTSQSTVDSTRPMSRYERARMQAWDELNACASCGSGFNVVRVARFGYVPFCQSCLDVSLHPGMWDDLGEAGD